MIDLATLTGSVVVALGEAITGLFSNNDASALALIKAGMRPANACGACLSMPIIKRH